MKPSINTLKIGTGCLLSAAWDMMPVDFPEAQEIAGLREDTSC